MGELVKAAGEHDSSPRAASLRQASTESPQIGVQAIKEGLPGQFLRFYL